MYQTPDPTLHDRPEIRAGAHRTSLSRAQSRRSYAVRFWSAILVWALTATTLTGCARYVAREATRGVVAIPSSSNGWPFRHRDSAHELMSEHFPAGYVIEREEEAVVGQTTNTDKTAFGGKRSTTRDDTEWRIYYRRQDASGFGENTPLNSQQVQPASYQGR